MELFIYIQSPIFNAEFEATDLFQVNRPSLFSLDAIHNAIISENIGDETILALIQEHIKEVEQENFSESLLPFTGGVYIQYDGKTIASCCCGDISDVENWKPIFTSNNNVWESIWIGHPQIAFKFDDKHIYFSEYFDSLEEIATKFTFDKNEFISLLKQKIALYESFKIQAYRVIEEMNVKNAEALKRVLF
jgi:hypothetical protein